MSVESDSLNVARIARQTTGYDPVVRFNFRTALMRAGKPEVAGIEPGDIVMVVEAQSPWCRRHWKGVVMQIFQAGDSYIRPIESLMNFKIRPSPEYMTKGLYLTREDQLVLITPVLDPNPDTFPPCPKDVFGEMDRSPVQNGPGFS